MRGVNEFSRNIHNIWRWPLLQTSNWDACSIVGLVIKDPPSPDACSIVGLVIKDPPSLSIMNKHPEFRCPST